MRPPGLGSWGTPTPPPPMRSPSHQLSPAGLGYWPPRWTCTRTRAKFSWSAHSAVPELSADAPSPLPPSPLPAPAGGWNTAVMGADAVVNLAGEPIASRWTREVRSSIKDSRVFTTHTLVS